MAYLQKVKTFLKKVSRYREHLAFFKKHGLLIAALSAAICLNYLFFQATLTATRHIAQKVTPTLVCATLAFQPSPTLAPTGTPSPTVLPTDEPEPTFEAVITPTLGLITDAYFNNLPPPLMQDADDWTVSPDGVRFAAFYEGFVGSRYDDGGAPGVGNCTIGYGHLLHIGPCNGSETMISISQEAAYKLLEQELNHCGTYVAEYTTVQLTQTQYNILSGLVCGWGYGKYSQSEMLKLLNQGLYFEAAEKLKSTAVYGIGIGLCPGLVRRRQNEAIMFIQVPGFVMWPFTEIK